MAKKSEVPKKYASVEQAIVEDLGAEFVGSYEKLGEFLVADGDQEHQELTNQAMAWLDSKHLMPSGASWSETDIVDALKGTNGVDVRIYSDKGWTEYHFMVMPDGTLTSKHYHMVEVSVLIPPKCDEAT
jgi:hypothetical protein